jgi:chromosome segregation ATPase
MPAQNELKTQFIYRRQTMKTQNTAKPIDEMTPAELQTALESTQAQIAADESEDSGLTAKMIAAAENGETEEWQRLHSLFNTLPLKIAGMNLRSLSIRILLKEKQLEAAQADMDTTGKPLEELREKADAAKKEYDEAQWANQDTYHRRNDTRKQLAALRYERENLQAAAAKTAMPQSKPLLRAA